MWIIEYLSRIGKAHGFGIQSPWAYSFVVDVIGERLPYYAYGEIDSRCSSRRERKLQRLYHRIRNFVSGNPFVVVDISKTGNMDILRMCREASPKGVVAVENIYANADCRDRWQQLKDSDLVGVTFDLYDVGICFLDRNIYKQHYKLNL